MLRVTSKTQDSIEIWELEGKLSGDWVAELERCWRGRVPQPGITVQVHLKAVSYIDAAGKQLLADMYVSGLEIKGCGCMARAVVEEIARGAGSSSIPLKKILTIILFAFCFFGGSALLAAREDPVGRLSVQVAKGARQQARQANSKNPQARKPFCEHRNSRAVV